MIADAYGFWSGRCYIHTGMFKLFNPHVFLTIHSFLAPAIYTPTISWLCCCLMFSVLCSAIQCIRVYPLLLCMALLPSHNLLSPQVFELPLITIFNSVRYSYSTQFSKSSILSTNLYTRIATRILLKIRT